MTLVEFLRARLDEDQAWAEGAAEGDGYRNWDNPSTGVVEVAGGGMEGLIPTTREAAVHIARHDPARVLAEVDAKRWIVGLHDEETLPDATPIGMCRECENVAFPCLTFQLLALPYADHPDYDPAWRPA